MVVVEGLLVEVEVELMSEWNGGSRGEESGVSVPEDERLSLVIHSY